MSAPEPTTEKVDPFIVAVDIVCVAAILSSLAAALFLANALIADLMNHHPALVAFALRPWVAPLLIGTGVALLGGIALLLLPAREQIDGEGSK